MHLGAALFEEGFVCWLFNAHCPDVMGPSLVQVVPLPLPTSQPLALEGKKDDSASPHEQPSLSLSPSAGSLSVRDDAQLNSLVTLEETEPDVADDLDSLVCPTPKLGIHNVRVNGETGQVPWLPDKTATAQVSGSVDGWERPH